jgi:hypothetical protein
MKSPTDVVDFLVSQHEQIKAMLDRPRDTIIGKG